jgi:hypothetical protein
VKQQSEGKEDAVKKSKEHVIEEAPVTRSCFHTLKLERASSITDLDYIYAFGHVADILRSVSTGLVSGSYLWLMTD